MNLSFHTYGRANLSSFTSQLKAEILNLSADLSAGKHTNLGKAQAVQILAKPGLNRFSNFGHHNVFQPSQR